MFRIIIMVCIGFLPGSPAWGILTPPVRAAYEFQFGQAWSAGVELPVYRILDLGKDLLPLAVNDSGTLLLHGPQNTLLRRTWGRTELLLNNHVRDTPARLNEANTVVALDTSDWETPRVYYWFESQDVRHELDLATNLIAPPYNVNIYALNDLDQVALYTAATDNWTFLPPENIHFETNLVQLGGNSWEQWAQYRYYNSIDYVLTQGGRLYDVYGLNNYSQSIGLVYEDSATSSAWDPEPVYSFQNQFYSLDMDTVLDFEPLRINDTGTILGRTQGPIFSMIIHDDFGQRDFGPVMDSLRDNTPIMSNPANGLEEIVLGPHYWKRMTERNLSGLTTGERSPDFWQGRIEDLVRDTGQWQSLEATALSANGRIAGTAWTFNSTTAAFEQHGFLLVAPALVTDWNRDGIIDTGDRDFSFRGEPWRFWINDDDDEGDVSRGYADDFPGSEQPDWANPGIDGLRDGVDFFPVLLDLQGILQAINDLSGVDVILRHTEAAVAFTYSSLLPEEVGLVHSKRLNTGFGPGMAEPLESATTVPVGSAGVSLADDFLQNLKRENRGVLLLEGTRSTTEPLIMELVHEGHVVLTSTLPLSISPVDDMFRIINLRNADPHFGAADPGPWTTRTGMPPNLPDRYLESFTPPLRTLVHIHGFNWGGDEIPAAHSELFKRLFQAGSNARYIGIIWYGDRGSSDLTGTSLEYNENVINAFITAGLMTEALAPFAGASTYALAHSLGNMVTSSAIADHGLQLGRYFMLSAAVPLEAYVGETADRRHMVHPDWKDEVSLIPDYAERLLSPNWHRLFQDSDNRSVLRWKSRFANTCNGAPCTNFYSTGEEILKTGDGDLPALFSDIFAQELIWVFNEMAKGTSTLTAALGTDLHGGWGFNRHFMEWVDPGGAAHPPAGDWQPISPTEADLIDSAELLAEPFFRPFAQSDSEFPDWGDSAWLYGATDLANAHLPALPLAGAQREHILNHAKILAEAIPAHSAPTGSQPISVILSHENINMDREYRDPGHWPIRQDADKRDRWLHSDYLNPALSFVFNLYRKCVEYINYMP